MQVLPSVDETAVFAVVVLILKYMMTPKSFRYGCYILPGPPGLPFLGQLLHVFGPPKAAYSYLLSCCANYPRNVFLWAGPWTGMFLQDPRDVAAILCPKVGTGKSCEAIGNKIECGIDIRTRNTDVKKSLEYHFMKPWLGESMLTTDTGPGYRRIKRMALPAFASRSVRSFLVPFNKHAQDLSIALNKLVGREATDIRAALSRCSMHTLIETEMGVDPYILDDQVLLYAKSVERICHIIHLRSFKVWLRPDFIFNRSQLKQQMDESIAILHQLTDKVIQRKKKEVLDAISAQKKNSDENFPEEKSLAFLDVMVEAAIRAQKDKKIYDDAGQKGMGDDSSEKKIGDTFTDQELRNEVLTIMFAGQDTTTATTGFVLTMLACNPRVQERVQQELDQIFDTETTSDLHKSPETSKESFQYLRPATWSDLTRMTYLEAVIRETWRMYPPVPVIGRWCQNDIFLEGGGIIPAGCTAAVLVARIHRHPEYYYKPDTFDPDRFYSGNSSDPSHALKKHNNAFIPFGAGPRACIGAQYAMTVVKVILSTLLRHYTFTSDMRPREFVLQASTTLKRKEGFPLAVHRRK